MAATPRGARPRWHGLRLAAAGAAAACALTAQAQTLDRAYGPLHSDGIGLSLDLDRVLPLIGPSPDARPQRRKLSPAASLPDPRALKGAGSRGEEARLRLNLKGFSLLELEEDQGARLNVRRIRGSETRPPGLSLTFQKRF